jgi:hypothetical protein
MKIEVEKEYMDFTYSDFVDLTEFIKIDKVEDLFNNYNPIIVSEDKETGTLLIRKMLKFGGSASYVYRLVKLDGSATEPKTLFTSQYRCQIWNEHVLGALDDKHPKKSAQTNFRFLAGIINYSEFLRRREAIGEDADLIL